MRFYAALLGGPLAEGSMGEGHEVVIAVASDVKDVKDVKTKTKWNGRDSGHVDALQRTDVVDGFEINLVLYGDDDRTTLDSHN